MPEFVVTAVNGARGHALEGHPKLLEGSSFRAGASTNASDSDESKGSPATHAGSGADVNLEGSGLDGADGPLEGTLNSNATNEFSFGTTRPAALPTEGIDAAPADPPKQTQELVSTDAGSSPVPPTSAPDAAEPIIDLAGDDSDNGGEVGTEFTFGTTAPLQLPDFSNLAHQADGAPCAPQQAPGAALAEARAVGCATNDHHAHVPLPPVLESAPMPPTAPPPANPPLLYTCADQIELRHASSNLSPMQLAHIGPAGVCYAHAPLEPQWSMPPGVMQQQQAPLGAMVVHAAVAQPAMPHYAVPPDIDVETAPGEAPYGPFFAAQTPESELAGAKFLEEDNSKCSRRLAALCLVGVLVFGAAMLVLYFLEW